MIKRKEANGTLVKKRLYKLINLFSINLKKEKKRLLKYKNKVSLLSLIDQKNIIAEQSNFLMLLEKLLEAPKEIVTRTKQKKVPINKKLSEKMNKILKSRGIVW